MNPSPKIPVGFATIVGQLASLAQFAGAIVILLVGTKAQAAQAVPVLLGSGGLAQFGVIAGRYLQAHKQIATTVAHVTADAATILPTLEQELAAPPPAETTVAPPPVA